MYHKHKTKEIEMKTAKIKFSQGNWEYYYNGVPVQISSEHIENSKINPVKLYLNSTYYQFANPCTTYSFGTHRENTVKTPYSDYDCVGSFELAYKNKKFTLTHQ
jgi:hypothetical protein